MKNHPIRLKKVKVHNLKEVSLSLEPQTFIVFTGVSGSGKSSLAFDTIFAEGQRRYLQTLPPHIRHYLPPLPKPEAEEIEGLSPPIAIDQNAHQKNPRSTVGTLTGITDFLRILFAQVSIPHCPVSGEIVRPQSREKILRTLQRYPEGTKILLLSSYAKFKKGSFVEDFSYLLKKGFTKARIDGEILDISETPALDEKSAHTVEIIIDRIEISQENFPRIAESVQLALEEGKGVFSVVIPKTKEERTFSLFAFSPISGLSYPPLEAHDFSFNHPAGMCPTCEGIGQIKKTKTSPLSSPCPECHGLRLKPYPLAALLGGKSINEITALTPPQAVDFFRQLSLEDEEEEIARSLIEEIQKRLELLMESGVHYLTLDRPIPSLSGGELQRVKLVSLLTQGLSGITYVLDEPSIGLHPRDQEKLINILLRLRDQGNTVIVVEHDLDTILQADKVVELGPGAGTHGGKIIFQGKVEEMMKNPRSITGAYLSGRKTLSYPSKKRKPHSFLHCSGISHHNLKNLSVSLPLHCFVSITGVSGSGKSSLVGEVLFPALANRFRSSPLPCGSFKKIESDDPIQRVVFVDQSPLSRTIRSNPATYLHILEDLRELFSSLRQSKSRGFSSAHFTFNRNLGSCNRCKGTGILCLTLDTSQENPWIPCPQCHGQRFDPSILSILYQGKNIAQILEMTVDEAYSFFSTHLHLQSKLHTLQRIGLGYLPLGQPSTTLSGGENQRLKLAKEWLLPSRDHTLYILDEPTSGLHLSDIDQLLPMFQQLVDEGNSLFVIEHNMDLVRASDWVVDLGPEAGEQGGKIVNQGTPEKIAKSTSPTGVALYRAFHSKKPSPMRTSPLSRPSSSLKIEHAQQNNLKDLSLEIAQDTFTVFAGPSGAGKSSLLFQTIYAEGEKNYGETLPLYLRQFLPLKIQSQVGKISGLRPPIAVEQKNHKTTPRSTVGTLSEIYEDLRILFAFLGRAYSPETGEEISMVDKNYLLKKILSFPKGEKIQILSPLPVKKDSFSALVEKLQERGFVRIRLNGIYYELDQPIPFHKQLDNELFLVIDRFTIQANQQERIAEAIDWSQKISPGSLLIAREKEELLIHLAFTSPSDGKSYPPLTPHSFSFNLPESMCPSCKGLGVHQENLCPACHGSRLNPLASHVQLLGKTIREFCLEELRTIHPLLSKLSIKEKPFLKEFLDQLLLRLRLMEKIGLGYLSLHRPTTTLSRAELQKILLTKQLGVGLCSCLYLLEEPATGFHPQEIENLVNLLEELRDKGNTILVEDNHFLLRKRADCLLEFGPTGGKSGGFLLKKGAPKKQRSPSLLKPPSQRRIATDFLKIKNCSLHNLKALSVEFPLGAISCICGLSGSGKSTLLYIILHALQQALRQKERSDRQHLPFAEVSGTSAFHQYVFLDQAPFEPGVRSDIASYLGILPALRSHFASLSLAKVKGFTPSHFSYNHKKGMCTHCRGFGYRKVELQFLPPQQILCEYCHGYRLNAAVLEVLYKGLHLGKILHLSVQEARDFFSSFATIAKKLDRLLSLGLGYLTLSQESSSLSLGEFQRLRFAFELARESPGKKLYLLDEPSQYLHSTELALLSSQLHRLTEQGHTVIVIEHHPDLIRQADWIVELGPKEGSKILASGTPERIAKTPSSLIKNYLDLS